MAESNLSAAAITRNLKTDFIGQTVIAYPSLTSTNDIAKREAKKGAREGTVVLAEEQTAGRGRIKRAWLSPKGSISLSIILHPTPAQLPSLIMVASLAVAHCIEKVSGLEAQIKWPNDVLINGKKVCGILIESDVRGNAVDHAVIGIGLNVNLKAADFPEITATATSLSEEVGSELSRREIIRCLLVEAESLYLALPEGDSVFREWRDRLVTLGKEVEVSSGKTSYRGVAESVASDGSLLLRQPDGRLIKIVAGDVSLRH
ncbi:MAG TPA: biotin--[acetyl-CoA-carboxylase] ligase [Dehalococcoidales bacterium]|nr:biotin--[acetyl-CoA-carboxylase] ligase [Dehalococcoidales bacterium]